MTIVDDGVGEDLAQRAGESFPPTEAPASAARATAAFVSGALRSALSSVLWAAAGLVVLLALWWLASVRASDMPSPAEGWHALSKMLSHPFYDNGPNDKGIGRQLGTSLGRVLKGFGLAVVVGAPLGFFMGASRRVRQAANPVVQLLRPVSPLAWFPIGLVVLKDSPNAAVFVLFITALWPIVINTAAGAASIPADHRNVAKVFRLGGLSYVRHVMVPHTMPHLVTGLRLSMGVAWMVIVAVEMLAGGTGIGFYVWDSYNGGNLDRVVAAILLIGALGYAIDAAFLRLAQRLTVEELDP